METYLQIDNVILNNEFSLNLCIVPIVCYIIVILDDKILERSKRWFLVESLSELLWQPLDQCPIAALTSKFQRWISSGEYELCNLQENSTKNYNSILPTIYMKSL